MINYQKLSELIPSGESHFSSSYIEARKRWVAACTEKGASLESLKLSSIGIDGTPLTLDFAWFGNRDAKKIILHVSGTHGIEGFLGSAIQLAIISCLEAPPKDSAYVFLHCLNPWGMSFLRRVTEGNVDLNRNFQSRDFSWSGSPPAYRALDSFLNPRHPPKKLDLFLFQAIAAILQYGYSDVKQAIAGGQYEFEKGLFFGGKDHTQYIAQFARWLSDNFKACQTFLGIEIHSGLGPFAFDTIFSPLQADDPRVKSAEAILKHKLSTDDPSTSVGFKTAGDLMHSVPAMLKHADAHWFLQEFGTYNNIKMLKVFRNENMHHHFGDGDLKHWSKKDLQKAFCPRNKRWRQFVIGRGVDLFAKLAGI